MTTLEFINISDSIYELCTKYPKLKEALFDLGFDKIKNPIMFNTVSKIMTLEKAVKMKNIDNNELRKKLNEYGFELNSISNKDNRNDILKSLIVKLHCTGDIESIKREFEDKFEIFWNEYPRHDNKQKTIKWFEKNNPSNELLEIMLEKIRLLKQTNQWKNKQYIPMPTTWLNGNRWEDEVIIEKPPKAKSIYEEI